MLIYVKIMIKWNIMPFRLVIGTSISSEHAGSMLRFKK